MIAHPWLVRNDFQDLSPLELKSWIEFDSKQVVTQSGAPCAWVFDLDSTLFCTGDRTRRILFDFLRSHHATRPVWWLLHKKLSEVPQVYNVEHMFFEALKSSVGAQRAQQEAHELWQVFRPFWTHEFFSHRFMQHDSAYGGSVELVNQVQEAGIEIVYLSGRDHHRSRDGSRSALVKAGFPMGHGTQLMIKKDASVGDLEFKERAASILKSRFRVSLTIDNEPENIAMFARAWPEARIVHFASVMSPRVPSESFKASLGGRPVYRLQHY
jgi:hypothetical protein